MKNLQKKIQLFVFYLTAGMPLFAAGDLGSLGLGKLETFADNILGIFGGKLIRTILICCLIACGVVYAFNKDNEKMKRNIIAIGVAILIIGAAQEIVAAFFGAAGK